jgi:hypothetical protein
MSRLQRISVVFSLAGYLLATTAVHALHDHSASCANELSTGFSALHAEHCDGSDGANCNDPADHGRPGSPSSCEDSCFACRFLAAKTIVPAIVVPVERFETVCQLEPTPPESAPSAQFECALCRGPPRAC